MAHESNRIAYNLFKALNLLEMAFDLIGKMFFLDKINHWNVTLKGFTFCDIACRILDFNSTLLQTRADDLFQFWQIFNDRLLELELR